MAISDSVHMKPEADYSVLLEVKVTFTMLNHYSLKYCKDKRLIFCQRSYKVVQWPSTLKTYSRVGQLSPKLKVQILSPNKDTWFFNIWFFTQPFNSQERIPVIYEVKIKKTIKVIPSRKEANSENWFFFLFL